MKNARLKRDSRKRLAEAIFGGISRREKKAAFVVNFHIILAVCRDIIALKRNFESAKSRNESRRYARVRTCKRVCYTSSPSSSSLPFLHISPLRVRGCPIILDPFQLVRAVKDGGWKKRADFLAELVSSQFSSASFPRSFTVNAKPPSWIFSLRPCVPETSGIRGEPPFPRPVPFRRFPSPRDLPLNCATIAFFAGLRRVFLALS